MKKTTILHILYNSRSIYLIYIYYILYFIIFISSISANNYIFASGNTFSMPQDNEENNSYHTYNIENNDTQYNSESYIIGNKPASTTSPGNKTKAYTNKNYNNSNSNNNNSSAQPEPAATIESNIKINTKNTQNKYNKNKRRLSNGNDCS